MISEYMEMAFNTETNEFKEMVDIIGPAFFRGNFNGSELHHIVPVTWFAQNDESRPSWATISDWGRLIRNSATHPANREDNLVYLTKEEHTRVHSLMSKIGLGDWRVPGAKINGKIQRLDKQTLEVLEEYDSIEDAAKWMKENTETTTNIGMLGAYVRLACKNPEISRCGYKWAMVG